MIPTNHFQPPAHRLYAWKSPAHTHENNEKQTGYIIVLIGYKSAIKSRKTYLSVDILIHDNLDVYKLKICLKHVKRKV